MRQYQIQTQIDQSAYQTFSPFLVGVTVTSLPVSLYSPLQAWTVSLSPVETRTQPCPPAISTNPLTERGSRTLPSAVLSTPELYLIDPLHTDSIPMLIHCFPEAVGLLGIVELQQDVFYLIAGNISVKTLQTTPGSYCVWKVDLSSGDVLDGSSSAIASKVTNIPEGIFLNGMAVLNQSEGLVVIGDAGAGVVF